MSVYEAIDFICDLVNPVMFFWSVFLIGKLSVSDRQSGVKFGLFLIWNLAATYAIMYVDNRFSLFKSIGIDYSTHTAFAIAVAAVLLVITSKVLLVAGILFSYGIAMLYQQYHTVEDMLVTAAVVVPIYAIGFGLLRPSKETEVKNAIKFAE